MSCGNPHELDCGEVLRRVEVFLEQEIGSGASVQVSYQRIERHLHECSPCEEEYEVRVYQLEEQVRSQMARCCAEHAPEELRVRVLQRLQALGRDLGTTP